MITKQIRKWLVSQVVALRNKMELTSLILTRQLAAEKGIKVEPSSVRRALNKEGYYYLVRSKKPKCNEWERAVRLAFSK